MFNTGARVQEIVDLRVRDLQLNKPFQVRLFGKGRKERYCPIWPETAAVLRSFCKQRKIESRRRPISSSTIEVNHCRRFGIRHILSQCLEPLRNGVRHLRKKRLHPHSMRHSTASRF